MTIKLGEETYYSEDYVKELQQRIDKAIEKIKAIQFNANKYGAEHDVIVCEELLDILKGSDNNE